MMYSNTKESCSASADCFDAHGIAAETGGEKRQSMGLDNAAAVDPADCCHCHSDAVAAPSQTCILHRSHISCQCQGLAGQALPCAEQVRFKVQLLKLAGVQVLHAAMSDRTHRIPYRSMMSNNSFDLMLGESDMKPDNDEHSRAEVSQMLQAIK